jgi:hypothetical protein
MQMSTHPVHRYETPEEEDELLDEVLHSASKEIGAALLLVTWGID